MGRQIKYGHLLHGGDYNPEQWLDRPDILKKDIEYFKEAKINTVSVGMFSWAMLEPEEGNYQFDWLEKVIDSLYAEGISTILSTPSGARPKWLSDKYPEVLRVNEKREKNLFGGRHNHCYTSPVYREKVAEIDRRLGEKFGKHPGVILWHISNEFGGECHCPLCQEKFREWLEKKYGMIENLNSRWCTTFWSHRYQSFSQIESPSSLGENELHALKLDWKRFVTEQTVDFMKAEIAALRETGTEIPVTTNLMYDYDGLDYREFMADLMKQRKKLSPVRLDMSREMDQAVIEALCRYLEITPDRVFKSEAPLDLSFIFQIQDLLRKNSEVFYEKRVPQKSPDFRENESILDQIREEDKLLSYPYESIRPFLKMLTEAAEDESVISIKMTLYRLAKQSKVVEALCEAAENGKEVVVLVELRARFDEENNIRWSRMLEQAGCQIIYGLEGYKVHSKLCLITRRSEKGIEYITQIGTGNYNEKTARLYTDLCLMTVNEQIGMEAARVFQALTKGEIIEEVDHLMVAPKCLQSKVIALIDEEIRHKKQGEDAYIGLKLNSLTDKRIIDKLVEASKAGVRVDMIIRGICCMVPGIKGETENVHIISIVGRFLEHSRIYIFGCGERTKYYIGSADFMTRNTVKRVEVAAPVYSEKIKKRIRGLFDLMLSDNKKARTEDYHGKYSMIKCEGQPCNSQEMLYQEAYDRAAIKTENKVVE